MSVEYFETSRKKGRGRAQRTLDLIDAMHTILEEIEPATVRAVCYRLFVAGLIPDMGKNSTGKVSRHLVTAREEGAIPWHWVVDENRQAERQASWDNPNELIRAATRQYRKNHWQMQPRWVEVWSEKGSVRGTLAPILENYGVTLRVMHGYSSATALYEVARETAENPKPLHVLYVGDWDPSGLNMSEVDIPNRLKRYSGMALIKRVALDETDVISDELPSFGAASKSKDSRHHWFVENFGQRCWELDALPPPMLRERVENEILDRLDQELWDHSIEVESAETDSMEEALSAWQAVMSSQV